MYIPRARGNNGSGPACFPFETGFCVNRVYLWRIQTISGASAQLTAQGWIGGHEEGHWCPPLSIQTPWTDQSLAWSISLFFWMGPIVAGQIASYWPADTDHNLHLGPPIWTNFSHTGLGLDISPCSLCTCRTVTAHLGKSGPGPDL